MEELLDSVINQKGNFELSIIVRDDGSSDNTLEILQRYQDIGDIKWYQGKNLGAPRSFLNLLEKNKNYDYYAFCDQDDVWLPNKIERSLSKFNNDDLTPQLVFCNSYIVNEELKPMGKLYNKKLALDPYSLSCVTCIQGAAMIFNNALAQLIRSNIHPRIILFHDSYVSKICSSVGGDISFIDECLMLYRQHSNNVLGIKKGILSKISNLILIFKHEAVPLYAQAEEIYDNYESLMNKDVARWYAELSKYNTTLLRRIKFAFSNKYKCDSLKWAVVNRIRFLVGNA